jgi:hypothetical protein
MRSGARAVAVAVVVSVLGRSGVAQDTHTCDHLFIRQISEKPQRTTHLRERDEVRSCAAALVVLGAGVRGGLRAEELEGRVAAHLEALTQRGVHRGVHRAEPNALCFMRASVKALMVCVRRQRLRRH